MKTYITDGLRCPECKDMVTNHSEIKGQHVPMCCGNVLIVEAYWHQACRWAVRLLAVPVKDYKKWMLTF